jgi:hypothetical protein
MKQLLLFFAFITSTPLLLYWSLMILLSSGKPRTIIPIQDLSSSGKQLPAQIYAALPENRAEIAGIADYQDARQIIIEKYLAKYHSPMQPYPEIAQNILQAADKNQCDPWLLVAIAQQESNLGKKSPPDCYNPFGWGIHSQGTLCFANWIEGIWVFAQGIKEKYIDKGYVTPEEIMAKYCPNSSGSWAFGVNKFINQLENGDVD